MQNRGLIRVDPTFKCVAVVLNLYTIVMIPMKNNGFEEHYVIYKSALGMTGQIKDIKFLHNCILPTMAILVVGIEFD